jgi:serine/threonine protein kinase
MHSASKSTARDYRTKSFIPAPGAEPEAMAEAASAERPRNGDIGYKSVQLLKKEKLGSGAYGTVCKAKCDELICAAKLIHGLLAVPQPCQRGKEHKHPVKRFERECEFLSNMRHPNIIQYLGTYTDPDTGRLVLLMELLDGDLTSLLEQAPGPLPFHKQVNICHDVAMALAFLHSRNIAHRDLSGKNILMIGDVRAKVTDFGMATLIDLGSPWQLDRQPSPTTNPGTEVYMPPEALLASAQRATDGRSGLEKIDSFSFGVVTLQILTRMFPDPGHRQAVVKKKHILGQSGIVSKSIPEATRRKEHIDLVDPEHKLRLIFLKCLNDMPCERPAAKWLCERLAEIKKNRLYRESTRGHDFEVMDGEAAPRSLRRGRGLLQRTQSFAREAQELRCNMEVLGRMKEVRDDLNKTIEERNKAIHEKDVELVQVNDQLKTKESVCEQQTRDLEQMHTLYEEKSKELERLKEKHVTREELNSVVHEKDTIIHETEMELQRINEQMKRKVRHESKPATEGPVSQKELNTALAEKDKTIHDKEIELQRVKGQLKKQATQYEQQANELKQTKEENKKSVQGIHEKELELKNASDQLKKLTKQCEQQSDKLKRMTEKLNGPKVPREDFDTAIQNKDDIIRERELEMKELREELERTKEVLSVQAHKNGTCLSDLNFTELQIPPDILEGTSKINGITSPGDSRHELWPSQQNEAASTNASDNTSEECRFLCSISQSIHRKDSEVIASGNTLYVASGRSTTIEALHAYNLHSTSQSGHLPDCPKKDYSLAVVDGLLTAIGGSGASKELYSLNCTGDLEGEGDTSRQRKWSEHFPPMSIGRQWVTAVCTDAYLIVAGGCIMRNGKAVKVLDNVEVLDIKKNCWSIASNLPEPLCLASGVVICGDTVRIGGGMDKNERPTKSMYSCSLTSLVKTSRPMKSVAEFEISMWDRFADLPADWSTCVSIGDSLLAVGGTYQPPSDQSESSSPPITSTAMSKVFRYNPANKSWEVVSYMLSARSGCFAVKPSDKELMVLGGGDKGVEIYDNFMP